MDGDSYVPAQYAKAGGIAEMDMRGLAKSHDKSAIPNRDPHHPSGGKRKRSEPQAEAPVPMDADADAGVAAAEESGPERKRRAYDNVSGSVSRRPWKASFGRASSIAVRPPPPPGDWDAKMAEKEKKRSIQASVAALKQEAKDKVTAERVRRADVKKRKEENRRKSAGGQRITNAKTIKKLSKKQASKLTAAGRLG